MGNKVNPRKIPKTQADCDRALNEGRIQGCQLMLTTIIWILTEKHDAPAADTKQLSEEIHYLLENIAAGNVSFPLVKKVLKEEYDWEVGFYVQDGGK
jgi:hypothetical protein